MSKGLKRDPSASNVATVTHDPVRNASRVAGLDTIRLAAAVMVAMSHGMLIPPQIYANQGSPAAFWSGQIAHVLASGTGAVALFFVISGLCIHLGREAAERNPLLFLMRRMVRIGLPLVCILLLIRLAGDVAVEVEKTVLWSVYCELGYYLAYPLLLAALRRFSMRTMLVGSMALSALLLALLPGQQLVWEYGVWTALICYPLWIAGAMLAEEVSSIGPRPCADIWRWRAGIILAAAACSLVRHFPGAENLSVLTYAVVGAFAIPFLRREIAQARAVPPRRWTEQLGRASYSMYLVHRYPLKLVEHSLAGSPQWQISCAGVVVVTACSFVFFILCERPALNLARAISFQPVRWKRARSAL